MKNSFLENQPELFQVELLEKLKLPQTGPISPWAFASVDRWAQFCLLRPPLDLWKWRPCKNSVQIMQVQSDAKPAVALMNGRNFRHVSQIKWFQLLLPAPSTIVSSDQNFRGAKPSQAARVFNSSCGHEQSGLDPDAPWHPVAPLGSCR